jgi:hypothetical protein
MPLGEYFLTFSRVLVTLSGSVKSRRVVMNERNVCYDEGGERTQQVASGTGDVDKH